MTTSIPKNDFIKEKQPFWITMLESKIAFFGRMGYRLDSGSGVWVTKNKTDFAYSDGDEQEKYIFNAIRTAKDVSCSSDELPQKIKDWPSEYHLSPLRINLMTPFRIKKRTRVLELGCGMGAITRYLGETGADVIAIDGSLQRAAIARERCRDLNNVQVVCNNFKDFQTDEKFDIVTLIGVMEYSPKFIGGNNPISECLSIAKNFLKPEGTVIIAIENRLGLKYWNNCAEDHTGRMFDSIHDAYAPGTVMTFGYEELKNVLVTAGFMSIEFMFPFPDYKLPSVILQEESFRQKEVSFASIIGQHPSRDYSGQSNRNFSEQLAWHTIENNGLIPYFANSFLCVCAQSHDARPFVSKDWIAKIYSSSRSACFRTETTIYRNKTSNVIQVSKERVYPDLTMHQGPLIFNQDIENNYIQGTMLSDEILRALLRHDTLDIFFQKMKEYKDAVVSISRSLNPEIRPGYCPGELLDCTPFNLVKDDNQTLHYIDNEWIMKEDLPLHFVLLRGILEEIINKIKFLDNPFIFDQFATLKDLVKAVFKAMGLRLLPEDIEYYCIHESLIQSQVAGLRDNESMTVKERNAAFLDPLNVALGIVDRIAVYEIFKMKHDELIKDCHKKKTVKKVDPLLPERLEESKQYTTGSIDLLNLHKSAIHLFKQGRPHKAIKIMHQALLMDPGNAEYHNDLGVLYFHSGRDDKATELFLRAIDLDDTQIDARKNLADLHAASGRITEAELLYKEVLVRQPDDTEALSELAAIYKTIGQLDKSSDYNDRISETQNQQVRENLSNFTNVDTKSGNSIGSTTIQKGECNICGSQKGFSLTKSENPRESWVCQSCGSTSRDRMYIYALSNTLGNPSPLISLPENTSISILEASGARAHPGILKTKFNYLNTQYSPERMTDPAYDRKVYADFQALNFDDNSFDIVMSSDVFEHIRLHKKALREIYRVLKPGGVMVLQAPFHPENKENIILVKPEGDKDVFLCPPKYHDEDTLVYRVYGAEFIPEIKSEGFIVQVIEDEVPAHCITRQNIILAQKPRTTTAPYNEYAVLNTSTASQRTETMKQGKINHGIQHAGRAIEHESFKMKRDWNKRAEENAKYYIHSTKIDQTQTEFDASGKDNVKSLVIKDLLTIAGGNEPKNMVALEIGCGIGRMTYHLADVFREVHGVDVSGEMIRQAQLHLKDLPNVHCHETNGTDLSIFPDEMFDFVFSFIVFQHIPSKEVVLNYLREAHRVLKTGGVFKFQVQGCTDPHWMKSMKDTWHGVTITEADINKVSHEVGFDILAKSGQGTQYSWYTLKKSAAVAKLNKTPIASVVIPVFNQLEYTKQCIEALKKHTPKDLYELIIVDNNSTDGTHEYLSGINYNVKIITNDENQGFTIACNQGAREAQGEYIVFLNNDTIPLDSWLTALIDTFKLGDDIGAVGSKLVYPDMRLQEAGGIIFSDGNGWNFGKGDIADHGRYNKLIEVDYCSAASLAVRKDIFDHVGGFDEIYAPAYYEDTDLCFSIREKGYRVFYQPESEIIHCEGMTAGSSTDRGFKRYQLINQEKFRKKWAHRLKDQGPSPYEGAPKPFTADRNRRLAGYVHSKQTNNFEMEQTAGTDEQINFLIIDPFLPIYDKASGSFRLFQIVDILANTPRVHVTYIARSGQHGDKYIELLTSLGVELYHTDPEKLFSFNILGYKHLINLKYILSQRHYHYAFLSFYEIALQYLPDIRLYSPDTRVVIDTVDIHFLREMRKAELYKDETMVGKAMKTKKNEMSIYQKADALITVTEQDADVVRPYFPDRPIHVIPNIHPLQQNNRPFNKRRGIIFIGNYSHPPNIDAVEYYIKDIHPIIQQKRPSIPVTIIGDNLPEHVKSLARGLKNITFTGWVPETKPYIDKARVSIAPLRYGAGMKGKVGEALAAGLPVVTTPIGAEGIGLVNRQDVLIANSAKEFADMIFELYRDAALWEKLSANGLRFIEKNYSTSAVKNKIRRIFNLPISVAPPYSKEHDLEKITLMTSIIILCFNQLEYTKKCLQSIVKYTSVPHELILVDNGSIDGTVPFLEDYANKHDNCKIILNNENRGFAGGNNQGIAAAEGDYILLLNNDVIVTQDWLERLIAHIKSDENIGMAGPVSNSVSGPQQVEHVTYEQNMNKMHKFARNYSKDNVGRTQEILRLVGFCLIIKRQVLDIIGGLDENYGNGNYEDDDLCLRSRIAGFRNIIAHDVFIHHYGSMTFKGNKIDYTDSLEGNRLRFADKWKDIIEVNGNEYRLRMKKEDQVKKLLEWGEERFSQRNFKAAVKIFERVLKLDKVNSQAMNNLGVIQWKISREPAPAMKTFQAALTLNPKDSDALENLVQAATESSRFDLINPALLNTVKKAQSANPYLVTLINAQQNLAMTA